MRMNIEKDIDLFKNRFKRSAEKTDLERLFDKCKVYVEEINKPLSEKRNCLKDKNDLMKNFEMIQSELTRTNDALRTVKARALALETTITDKVDA